nr:class I SAM-dependent methyltransferase [Nocardiopsis xinjiangensis]
MRSPRPLPSGSGSAGLFNATVAGFAIASAWEVGALDALREQERVSAPDFAARHDLHLPATRALFTALAAGGVCIRDETDTDLFHTGPELDEVYRHKAFFHWLTIGSAGLFSDMPRVMRNANRVGDFYRRDAAAIGFACRDINQNSFDPVFWEAMHGLDFEFSHVADLGCGSGGRLAQIASFRPEATGVGIDLAPDTIEAASDHLAAQGVGDRFTFAEADVRDLAPDPEFEKVELLTCFMMGHDFWPREQCIASLRKLREAFPNVKRFLLGDTARTSGVPDQEKPVFTLAFETAHDFMGVYLPTLQEWEGVFEEGGWKLHNTRTVHTPADSVLFELS